MPYRESDVWNLKPEVYQRNQGTYHPATTPMTSTNILVDQKSVDLQRRLMAGMRWGSGKIMLQHGPGETFFFFQGCKGFFLKDRKQPQKVGK